jgi:hypothetical protein
MSYRLALWKHTSNDLLLLAQWDVESGNVEGTVNLQDLEQVRTLINEIQEEMNPPESGLGS